MGMYIEGIEFPKKGRYTTFTVYNDGTVVYRFGGNPAGKATPAADVAPVRHGKWIVDGYYNEPCVCSNCGEPCRDFVMDKPRWNYCPNCGAEMEGN